MTAILRTDRLTLQPLALADAAALHTIFADPDAMAWWDTPAIAVLADVEAMVARQCADMAGGTHLYWTVRDAAMAVVGLVDLSDIDREARSAEIGYILAPGHWRQGYASEAMGAVIRHGEAIGLRRLSARIHAGNDASVALLTRLGFAETARLPAAGTRQGEVRDCVIYAREIG